MNKIFRTPLLALLGLLIITGCTTPQDRSSQAGAISVKIIALNDFHGYLNRADNAELYVSDPDQPNSPVRVQVGGVAYIASLIKKLKAENPNAIVVSAGDLVGASPAISSFTQDEATINIMGQMGMEVSVVGNHEFDRGKVELLRLQNGGCAPGKEIGVDTCVKDGAFKGAQFPYLAGNVIDQDTQKLLFPATFTKKFGDVTVGFVGVTLRDTPKATRGAGGLTFLDEIEVINTQASALKKQGVEAVVVLLHQGGGTTAKTLNDKTCPGLTGQIIPIVQGLKNVDAVLSAHTHREYVCTDPKTGILFTQANYYGNVVTDMTLDIVPGKGVVSKKADNIPVLTENNKKLPRGYTVLSKDPEIDREVQRYDEISKKKRAVIQGYIAAPLPMITIAGTNSRNNNAEHLMGDVIADAYLASAPASVQADIALLNPGGVRGGLRQAGPVTYDQLFGIAPFGNNLFYVDLTGEQLIRLLEQQWEEPNCKNKPLVVNQVNMCGRLLQPSATLTYTWDVSRGPGKPSGKGDLVLVDSIRIGPNQEPIDLKKKYRIVTDSFLAEEGGDNFTVFKEGTGLQDMGDVDIEAIVAYFNKFTKSSPMPAPKKRVTCHTCPAV
ncbi:bifunctional metallophosphatase/5'-nucleotidase [Zwartia vadi]|uniref:bifunctional metallophosphatase/5'-nucleotidase n=1 Tax=Zwartia vadi TaxID=3058168 RepID=UPI0025B315B1|nr:bifunctional metallophosphatase/5'-nucleotidase [Zwartia vadi]MDN3988184.1 bifunctional metallophosphatase/5'-nucleotidase [Zwartia vadi]